MASGSSEETFPSGGKSTKSGKEGKNTKEPKEGKKPKDGNITTVSSESKNDLLLQQMAADLAAVTANLHRLQSDVDTLKELSEPAPSLGMERSKKAYKGPSVKPNASGASAALLAALNDEPAVAVVLAVPSAKSGDSQDAPFVSTPNQSALSAVDTADVAKLGYAFSSAPKVALIRMLLENGEQTAAQLGEGAGLTTGSLYHHLRELVHAEVASQSSRNHYSLTDLGRRTTLVMLALQV
jgi:hypothetical protein